MPHKVVFGRRALAALLNIETYLMERSPSGAGNVVREIQRSAALLEHFPLLGTQIPDTNTRYHVTHKYRYRIVYRVRGDNVQVLMIYHPRQR